MSIQNKPDYKIFADGAKPGEVVAFPDVLRGWGVTLDATGGIPPMEFMNGIMKRLNEWLMYLTQRGIPEWDASVDYPKSSVVMMNNGFYVSLKQNKGDSPSSSQNSWGKFSEFFGIDGKLDKTSVVQTSGSSLVNVMSQKAVTDAINNTFDYPIGSPIPWPKSTPPGGFLICNGQTFSKSAYPLLASAYPSGALPDLRGEFIRGLDAARGVDSGRAVLSAQGDAIRNITGSIYARPAKTTGASMFSSSGAFVDADATFTSDSVEVSTTKSAMKGSDLDISRVVPTASENRPRNIAFLYIMRAA